MSIIKKMISRSKSIAAYYWCGGLLVAGLLLFCGCGGQKSSLPPRTYDDAGWRVSQKYTLGYSLEHRPIDCSVIGTGPETILYIAVIHGNEPAGAVLLRELTDYLQKPETPNYPYRFVIVPVVNPDGWAKNQRYNSHGVDLNRNFPAANRKNQKRYGNNPLSEPEAKLLYNLIKQYRPSCVVSIHQPLSCIDYDGPAKNLAQRMSQFCDLPVRKLGGLPGSLGSYLGEDLRIPTITMELSRKDSNLSPDQLWRGYGLALLSVITRETQPQR